MKNTLKRTIALFIAVMMVFCLTACGDSETASNSSVVVGNSSVESTDATTSEDTGNISGSSQPEGSSSVPNNSTASTNPGTSSPNNPTNSQATQSQDNGPKAKISGISIGGKALSRFSQERKVYAYELSSSDTKAPQVSASKTKGSGDIKITQATSVNGQATVTLNGETYTIQFAKKDKSTMLNNTYYKLKVEKKLNVAYFGGSVTAGFGSTGADTKSWRAMTTKWLKEQFPNATINETNAAIGGTGSEFGAYRIVEDLKLKSESERPDLVFVEFAINDVYDGCDSFKNMEAIINSIYKYAPNADIVMAFTTDFSKKDSDYAQIVNHKEVAAYYGVPYVYLGAQLYKEIVKENGSAPSSTSNAVWAKYFIDIVHPTDAGYAKYAGYMREFLSDIFSAKKSVPSSLKKKALPSKTLNQLPVNPHTVSFEGQTFSESGIRFIENGYIRSDKAGSSFTFEFTGTDISFWAWGAARGCKANVVIDGTIKKEINFFRDTDNHLVVPVASGLSSGKHTVTVTMQKTTGRFMQINRVMIAGAGNEGIRVTK